MNKVEAVLSVDQRAGFLGGWAMHWLWEVSKVNRICLSSGGPSADAGTVDVEAENPFSSFIARSVMNFVIVLHY